MRALISSLLATLLLVCAPAQAQTHSIPVPDFGKLERELRLKPLQKAQFDIAVEASQLALMSVALVGLQVKERLTQELSKPNPDLNVLYKIQEDVMFLAAPNFRAAGEEWQRLFKMLDRAQVDAARRFLRDNLGNYLPGTI